MKTPTKPLDQKKLDCPNTPMKLFRWERASIGNRLIRVSMTNAEAEKEENDRIRQKMLDADERSWSSEHCPNCWYSYRSF